MSRPVVTGSGARIHGARVISSESWDRYDSQPEECPAVALVRAIGLGAFGFACAGFALVLGPNLLGALL